MPRTWIWLQLLLGWLPVGAVFALMFRLAHGGPVSDALFMALQLMLTAALLGILVYRFTERVPWPHPLRLRFVATQGLAALAYALAWFVINVLIASAVASVLHSRDRGSVVFVLAIGPAWGTSYIVLGIWLYVMVAGIAYANGAAQRSAQIEALAARTQLAALRTQLHPHLLFNALHTVVQLIPVDPKRATHAAEQLAEILRTTLANRRDVVPLSQEWNFVQRYLAIETLRFGDRLSICSDIEPAALGALVPAFAVQTLVENAVRHAAAPRARTTTIEIAAKLDQDLLILTVADDGPGADAQAIARSSGTGIRRLRERLYRLGGDRATLDLAPGPNGGLRATLALAQSALRAALKTDDAHDE